MYLQNHKKTRFLCVCIAMIFIAAGVTSCNDTKKGPTQTNTPQPSASQVRDAKNPKPEISFDETEKYIPVLETQAHADWVKEWQDFRTKFPYNFQMIGTKKYDDGSYLMIVSEPPPHIEVVEFEKVFDMFKRNSGDNITIEYKTQPIGYDGWLKDAVVCVSGLSDEQWDLLISKLSTKLYFTNYKAKESLIPLPVPVSKPNYLPGDYNLQISSSEIKKWFVDAGEDRETIVPYGGGVETNLPKCFEGTKSGGLYHSGKTGFIVWVIDKKTFDQKTFQEEARKFALDSDLIVGSIHYEKSGRDYVTIIARERQATYYELPPLRVETIVLLASTDKDELSQSYERNHLFAGKLPDNNDYAPILLSDELWHTEYGNLLNVTDQMLKSWSENGGVSYINFDYEQPIDWAFDESSTSDLEVSQLTFNWNTAAAGYTHDEQENLGMVFYALNRTGSLPVSYIPEGMSDEITTDNKVYIAEENAYDFFSHLKNPELIRVVQYASLYQIFNTFKVHCDDNKPVKSVTAKCYADGCFKVLEEMCKSKNLDKQQLINYLSQDYFNTRYKRKLCYDIANNIAEANVTILSIVFRIISMLDDDVDEEEQEADESPYRSIASSILAGYRGMNDLDADARKQLSQYLAEYLDSPRKCEEMLGKADDDTSDEEISLELRAAKIASGILSYYDMVLRKVLEDSFDEEIDNLFSFLEELQGKYDLNKASYVLRLKSIAKNIVEPREARQELSRLINEYNDEASKYNQILRELKSLEVPGLFSPQRTYDDKSLDSLFTRQWKLTLQSDLDSSSKRIKTLEESINALEILQEFNHHIKEIQLFNEFHKIYLLPKAKEEYLTENRNSYLTWCKCPTIVLSMATDNPVVVTGGHNLGAKPTPIKIDPNLAAGKSEIRTVNGQKTVYVRPEDVSNVSPSFLRKIERTNFKGGIISDAQKPARLRQEIIEKINRENPHGFNSAPHLPIEEIQRTIDIEGITRINGTELRVALEIPKRQGKLKIIVKNATETELLIHVEMPDGKTQFIRMSRGDFYHINKELYHDPTFIHNEEGIVVEWLSKRSADAGLRMTIPEAKEQALEEVKSIIEGLWKQPTKEIDLMKEIKPALRKPDLKNEGVIPYDIKLEGTDMVFKPRRLVPVYARQSFTCPA